jgi:uncharacterized cofD-like protein
LCADYTDGTVSRGENLVDAGQTDGRAIKHLWLEPMAAIRPAVAEAIRSLDAVVIAPGSFFTSLLPIFLVSGCRDALAGVKGPVVLTANLLTEGRGMEGFSAAEAVARLERAIGRRIDVVIANAEWPDADVLAPYQREHKAPLPVGSLPAHCELVTGGFWHGTIARHDRGRLASAVWSVLANRLL